MFWTVCICAINIIALVVFYKLNKKNKQEEATIVAPQLSTSDIEAIINYSIGKTNSAIEQLNNNVARMPSKVVESITGSTSNQKGKVGELIAYLNLNAEYDRLIPLGNFVDFIGIKFQTENHPGIIAFIDIKNGKSARLSTDQKQIKSLILDKKIEFITHKVSTEIHND